MDTRTQAENQKMTPDGFFANDKLTIEYSEYVAYFNETNADVLAYGVVALSFEHWLAMKAKSDEIEKAWK
jgi:hypothetical protein